MSGVYIKGMEMPVAIEAVVKPFMAAHPEFVW